MENKDNLTDSVTKNQAETNDSYSIYHYFEKHPAFFATCVSALVAVASYCIKIASNRYSEKYYSYWNVDVNLISIDDSVGHIVLQAFVFVLSLITIHAILGSTADSCMKQRQQNGLLRKQYRELKKEIKKGLKRNKKVTKTCGKNANKSKKARRNNKRKNGMNQQASCSEKRADKYQKLKEAVRKYRFRMARNIIAAMLVSFLICTASILFLIKEDGVEFWIASIILSFGIVCIWSLCYFIPTLCGPTHISKETSESNIHQLTETNQNDRFPLETVATDGFKGFVSNKAIKAVLIVFLFALFVNCFSVGSLAAYDAEKKTSYPIYADQAGMYAVVYNSKDTIILEEITICDNKAIIDASKQRIINSEDISFVIWHFDEVCVEKNGD